MYRDDRKWADACTSQVLEILRYLVRHLVVLSVAPTEEDNKRATDFIVRLIGGAVAVRLRRSNCQFRDFTIRALRDSGTKTELAKIREGYASRYFYGWLDETQTLAEWVLIDLDKVRKSGLLEKQRPFIPNGDGTYFISITLKELADADCLIASKLLEEVPA